MLTDCEKYYYFSVVKCLSKEFDRVTVLDFLVPFK